MIVKTDEEITKLYDEASRALEQYSKYPGMTYEEGLMDAIDWITGELEGDPLED